MAYNFGSNGEGDYSAAAFAYGVAGSSCPSLKIFQGNAATGAQSVFVVQPWITLADGSIVAPLATTTPVLVGLGSTAETVTPSAVTGSNTGYLAPGTGGFTATFANTHGQGEPVASGTAGLQEAINYVASIGGGVVEVDQTWVTLGGTTAMLNAAVNGSKVLIADRRGPGGVVYYAWNGTTFQASINQYTPILVAASGAIVPGVSGYYVITKAGVAAMTLAAPVAADNGKIITVTSRTANAHTLTATGLLNTGSASVNLATFAANAGAGLTLVADNLKFNVLSQIGITFS